MLRPFWFCAEQFINGAFVSEGWHRELSPGLGAAQQQRSSYLVLFNILNDSMPINQPAINYV